MKKSRSLLCLFLVFAMLLVSVSCKEKDSSSKAKTDDDPSYMTDSELDSDDGDDTISGTDVNSDGTAVSNGSGTSSKNSGTSSKSSSSKKATTSSKNADTSGSTASVEIPKETMNITYATLWGGDYTAAAGTDKITDLYNKKFKEIKEKYNVNIKVQPIEEKDIALISRAINKNDDTYQIIELHLASIRNMARAGALYDQSKIATLNLNASQFVKNSKIIECLTYNNKVYGTCFGYPDGAIMGVFVNKKLVSENVNALYKSGDWTTEKFAQVAKASTTNRGQANAVYGVGGDGSTVGMALCSFAGGTVTRVNGKYISAMPSDDGIKAMNWVRQLVHTDQSFLVYNTNLVSQGYVDFAAGKFAMLPTYLGHAGSFVGEMDSVTFVPFPKTSKQAQYSTGAHDCRMYAVPKSVKNPDLIGAVLMELSTIGPEITSLYEQRYRDLGLDAEGVKAVIDMANYVTPEFARGIDFSSIDAQMNNSVFQQNGNPGNTMKSVSGKFDSLVDDYYSKFK